MRQYRPHFLVLFIVGLVFFTGMHDYLTNAIANMRSSWITRNATGKIVVVAIDSRSIQKIGTWPWSRTLYGKLIGILESAGVSDIAFDVDFSSPSRKAADDAFMASLEKAGGAVILPEFRQRLNGADRNSGLFVNRPLPRFEKHSWTALVNVQPDSDGIVRRYPLGSDVGGTFVPSMAAMLAGRARLSTGSFWIDFGINPGSVPIVSFVDVLKEHPSVLSQLRNKRVIIGGTALELGDRFTTPSGRIISGPVLQAMAAESILQGRALRRISGLPALLGAGLVMGIMILAWPVLSSGRRALLLFGLAASAEIAAVTLQRMAPIVFDTSLIHVCAAGYLIVIALDEIDFRGMLSRIAENRFERVAMSLGDGLICTDGGDRITLCNPSASAILGYSADEVVGRSIGDLMFDADITGQPAPLTIVQDGLDEPGGKMVELGGRRKNGDYFPIEACISSWQGRAGAQYGIVFRDISVRKREVEKIRFLAEFDTLTSLPNRHILNRQLEIELTRPRGGRDEVALLLIDLDTFKEINDSLGHSYGDRVLIEFGKRLRTLVGETGFVARFGGDEFAIIVSGANAAERAQTLCDDARRRFKEAPIVIDGSQFRIEASIGVAICPEHGSTVQELLGNADLALYRAKDERRGRHVLFDPKFRRNLEARVALEVELNRAVERGEFELFYQPQVALATGKLVGAEALIRWRHPTRKLVSPTEFMSIVNASTISSEVGCWVLETACAQGAAWQRKGNDVRIAINLSPAQLRSDDLSVVVSAILQEKELAPSQLELEVTEDIVLADEDVAIMNFRKLQEIGVRLAFDDFGTGYAGLSYLKKFALDVLKIDRSFVADLCRSADDKAIVSATIAMSRQFGLTVIAEGIEDQETADLLRKLGCHEGQGYLYGKPMPATEFESRFLNESNALPCKTEVAVNAA